MKTYPPPTEALGAEPRFPPMVLVATFVTPVAPSTAKLAKSELRIGAAHAAEALQSTPISVPDMIDKYFVGFILISLVSVIFDSDAESLRLPHNVPCVSALIEKYTNATEVAAGLLGLGTN